MFGRATTFGRFFNRHRFLRSCGTSSQYKQDENFYCMKIMKKTALTQREIISDKYAYLGGAAAAGVIGIQQFVKVAKADHAPNKELSAKKLENLPLYRQEDVKQHGRDAERIWVTYKDVSTNILLKHLIFELQGVYDVTDFISMHPGGDKILLAAGAAVDPFWALYSQHKTKEVLEILEGYRIGRLDVKDVPKVSCLKKKLVLI